LKFDIGEKETKAALQKVLSGVFEGIDSLVDTCDSRIVRNIAHGTIKSIEDACHKELKTKQVLSQSELPARVENIEKEQKTEETETGSIEAAPATQGESQEEQEQQVSTKTKVSKFVD
jgi:hypothetical protein